MITERDYDIAVRVFWVVAGCFVVEVCCFVVAFFIYTHR